MSDLMNSGISSVSENNDIDNSKNEPVNSIIDPVSESLINSVINPISDSVINPVSDSLINPISESVNPISDSSETYPYQICQINNCKDLATYICEEKTIKGKEIFIETDKKISVRETYNISKLRYCYKHRLRNVKSVNGYHVKSECIVPLKCKNCAIKPRFLKIDNMAEAYCFTHKPKDVKVINRESYCRVENCFNTVKNDIKFSKFCTLHYYWKPIIEAAKLNIND